jgi:hypothetical protein
MTATAQKPSQISPAFDFTAQTSKKILCPRRWTFEVHSFAAFIDAN